jgi:hypothetical protein
MELLAFGYFFARRKSIFCANFFRRQRARRSRTAGEASIAIDKTEPGAHDSIEAKSSTGSYLDDARSIASVSMYMRILSSLSLGFRVARLTRRRCARCWR